MSERRARLGFVMLLLALPVGASAQTLLPAQDGQTTAFAADQAPAKSPLLAEPPPAPPPLPAEPLYPVAPPLFRTDFWVQGEYLAWWLMGARVPPLVTTSAAQTSLGRLGFLDTAVLFGGDDPNAGDPRHGARISAGCDGFGPGERLSVEGNFWFLGRHGNTFLANSTGDPLLARPFFDPRDGTALSELVANLALPGIPQRLGSVAVANPSEVYGAEFNLGWHLAAAPQWRITGLVGVRNVHVYEGIVIRQDSFQPADAGLGLPETRLQALDSFQARNQFWGGQVGLRGAWGEGPLIVEAAFKVALGANHQRVDVFGARLVSPTGGPAVFTPAGLLALGTNSGPYERDKFCAVPEVTLQAGYTLAVGWRVFAGYNLIWLTSVVRPGDQIDQGVNPTNLPGNGPPLGPARPEFRFRSSDLWIQGVTAGVEWNY
jgi:hypothetical protein